jgi:hypothetical protein
MGGPAAGVQIKKWFTTLIALIFFLDGVGMVGLFLMRGSIRTIALEAQPLITTAEEINRGNLEARVILYRYLGESLDSPAGAMTHLENIQKAAERGLALTKSEGLRGAFDTIAKQSQQYALVISSLPDSSQGSIDWGSINELTTKAREVSDAMLKLSGEVKQQSQREIETAIGAAQKVAAATTTLFLGFLVVSLVIVAMMLYWWRKFQEMILEL